MDDRLRQIVAAAGMDKSIVDKLDQILVGPNDRAYVICTFTDCKQNIKGRCTIFTLLDVPPMRTGQPCDRYET